MCVVQIEWKLLQKSFLEDISSTKGSTHSVVTTLGHIRKVLIVLAILAKASDT
jgi:hypothetical protein